MNRKFFLIILFLTFISGCSKKADLDARATDKKIENLEFRLQKLENQMMLADFEKITHSAAIFDPSSTGFQKVDTDNGSFLVSLSDIKPYGDGYKIKVNLGNPSFATYNQVKVIVAWNKRQGDMSSDEWMKTMRETNLTLRQSIVPGSWNSTQFVIAPAAANETGFLRVKLEAPIVSLRTK